MHRMRYRLCSKVQHIYTNDLSTIVHSYYHSTASVRPCQQVTAPHISRSCIHFDGYLNRPQPRRCHNRVLNTNAKAPSRQQHGQAVAEREDIGEGHTSERHEYKHVHHAKQRRSGSSNLDGRVASIVEENTATLANAKAADRLLRLVGKFSPYTTPTTRIIEDSSHDQEDGSQDTEQTIRVELVNEEYKITCVEAIKIAGQTQDSLEQVFEQLARKYMREVEVHLGLAMTLVPDTRAYSAQPLYETLEMGTISIDVAPFELNSPHARNLELFRAQVYSGHEPLGRPQIWTSSGTAQRLARASADVEVLKRAEQAGIDIAPTKLPSDAEVPNKKRKKKNIGFELERVEDASKVRAYEASISPECLDAMLFSLREARMNGLPDEVQLNPWQQELVTSPPEQANRFTPIQAARMKQEYISKMNLASRVVQDEQRKLPIRHPLVIEQIHRTVQQNDVLLLISETGSGKTTQLPQILLEKAIYASKGPACNIICTQPRRIAATSVATRVAYEQNTYIGGSVGYQVRFDRKLPRQRGSINYSTAGVLLKTLQDQSQRILDETSHIVVDEVHERDLTVDLLIALLRDLMRIRKESGKPFPKLILMSATMDSMDLERYFAEHSTGFSPLVTSIKIPGRTYPVSVNLLDDIVPRLLSQYADDKQVMSLLRGSQQYLEWEDEFAVSWKSFNSDPSGLMKVFTEQDSRSSHPYVHGNPVRDATMPFQLIALTVMHILRTSKDGDILVFLPGMKEIDTLADTLLTKMPSDIDFSDRDKLRIFKLHSALHESNGQVFAPVPLGCRRVILATNIAQTSITLPGVVHVIDSGKRRDMAYDPISRKNEFISSWIDQATSIQRRGRAGRVQDGHYWAMFTDARFQSMPRQARPEILTSDLTGPSLTLKSSSANIDLQTFFGRMLDPPGRPAVAACIKELQELCMLTSDEKITPLGKFCSDFPLHPAKARGLLLGFIFGCFEPLLIVASHSADSPLINSAESRQDMYHSALTFAGVSDDDRYAFVEAFLEYDQAVRTNSEEDIKSLESKQIKADAYRNMCSVARQLYDTMAEYGLMKSESIGHAGYRRATPSVLSLVSKEANVNARRVNLFKALALSVVDTNLAVWNEHEQSWLVKDLKCMLKPYSVNTKQSLKLLKRTAHRTTGEVVCFGEMVRNVISSPRPFLVETSSITPLVAMLFGGPIVLIDDDTIEIDGWLRYRVTVRSSRGEEDQGREGKIATARVIFELRKAIDRLLTTAFAELRHRSTASLVPNQPPLVLLEDSRLRKVVTRGLLTILETDARHWDEVIQLT